MNQQRRILSHNSEPRSSSNERPRSRAIRIQRISKTSVNVDDLDEIPRSSDRGMYAWATWRMYNRIIDHRQKYPITLNEDTTSIDVAQTSPFASPLFNRSSNNGNLLSHEAAYPMPIQHSDYSQEFEVFDFDPWSIPFSNDFAHCACIATPFTFHDDRRALIYPFLQFLDSTTIDEPETLPRPQQLIPFELH
jgi:hypothetical protein